MKYQIAVVNDAATRKSRVAYRVEAGEGVMTAASRVVSLRPGLLLNISGVEPAVEASFTFEIDKAPIQFGFIVSGANKCTYHDGIMKNKTQFLQSGNNGIYYLPQTSGTLKSDQTSGVCVVSFLTTACFLQEYFQQDSASMPVSFQNVLYGKPDQFLWSGKMNTSKKAILSQILFNKYVGPVQKLFLESRVLELMAWQLDECLGASANAQRQRQRLKNTDVERIKAARELLVKDFENPPSMTSLAKSVGVNEKKLKYGFKEVYGQPVFEYFRDYRLERAREMLASGGVSVSETAYQIGYQSLSHFSRAFRERYGLNPKDYGRLRGLD